jgi:hypothetical protein
MYKDYSKRDKRRLRLECSVCSRLGGRGEECARARILRRRLPSHSHDEPDFYKLAISITCIFNTAQTSPWPCSTFDTLCDSSDA